MYGDIQSLCISDKMNTTTENPAKRYCLPCPTTRYHPHPPRAKPTGLHMKRIECICPIGDYLYTVEHKVQRHTGNIKQSRWIMKYDAEYHVRRLGEGTYDRGIRCAIVGYLPIPSLKKPDRMTGCQAYIFILCKNCTITRVMMDDLRDQAVWKLPRGPPGVKIVYKMQLNLAATHLVVCSKDTVIVYDQNGTHLFQLDKPLGVHSFCAAASRLDPTNLVVLYQKAASDGTALPAVFIATLQHPNHVAQALASTAAQRPLRYATGTVEPASESIVSVTFNSRRFDDLVVDMMDCVFVLGSHEAMIYNPTLDNRRDLYMYTNRFAARHDHDVPVYHSVDLVRGFSYVYEPMMKTTAIECFVLYLPK